MVSFLKRTYVHGNQFVFDKQGARIIPPVEGQKRWDCMTIVDKWQIDKNIKLLQSSDRFEFIMSYKIPESFAPAIQKHGHQFCSLLEPEIERTVDKWLIEKGLDLTQFFDKREIAFQLRNLRNFLKSEDVLWQKLKLIGCLERVHIGWKMPDKSYFVDVQDDAQAVTSYTFQKLAA